MTRSRGVVRSLLLSTTAVLWAAVAQAGDQVAICHRPPGNPANAQTIVVGAAAVGAHLRHGDDLGECRPVCSADGTSCTGSDQCCSGNCVEGTCTPTCTVDGDLCGSSAECCGGICSDDGICASQCTAGGPELDQPRCDVTLPCCPGMGVCVGGFCWADSVTCSLLNGPCDDLAGEVCCFDYVCGAQGVCVEP